MFVNFMHYRNIYKAQSRSKEHEQSSLFQPRFGHARMKNRDAPDKGVSDGYVG